MFICFTGIDGSGKTTHAKSVVRMLSEQGYSCTYVWAAHRPVVSYVFYGITRMLGFWKEARQDALLDPFQLSPAKVRKKLTPLWLLSLFLDLQIIVLFKNRLPIAFGRIVISDRYVYDLIMELISLKTYSPAFHKLVHYSFPTPNIIFLMDAPVSIANQRHHVPTKLLSIRKNIYLGLAKVFGFTIVDTTKNIAENEDTIRHQVLVTLKAARK